MNKYPHPRNKIDGIVFRVVVICAVFVFGMQIGKTDSTVTTKVEYVSPVTKCTKHDFAGESGQKRCLVWRRVV